MLNRVNVERSDRQGRNFKFGSNRSLGKFETVLQKRQQSLQFPFKKKDSPEKRFERLTINKQNAHVGISCTGKEVYVFS